MATKVKRRRARRSSSSRRGYSRKFTLPLAAVAGLAPLTGRAIEGFQAGYASGGFPQAMRSTGSYVTVGLTGFNPDTNTWDWTALRSGLLPMVLGILAHKVVGGMLGVNRLLGRANVPVVRI